MSRNGWSSSRNNLPALIVLRRWCIKVVAKMLCEELGQVIKAEGKEIERVHPHSDRVVRYERDVIPALTDRIKPVEPQGR